MADEWRVSLFFDDRSDAWKTFYYRWAVRSLLRGRVGDEITVSGGELHIFMYAETVTAAEQAEQVALEVLAQQNLSADVRLERWDPAGEAWRDTRSGSPDRAAAGLPAAQDDDPEPGRLRSAATALAGGVVQAVIDGTVSP